MLGSVQRERRFESAPGTIFSKQHSARHSQAGRKLVEIGNRYNKESERLTDPQASRQPIVCTMDRP